MIALCAFLDDPKGLCGSLNFPMSDMLDQL
jgi:hypothetical protein